MSSTFDLTGESGEWDPADVEFAALCASPVGMGGRELGDRLVEIDRARRALEAATMAVLDEAERGGSFRDDGHITLGSWARATVNWSYAETSNRVRAVDLVRLCPAVSGELVHGRLGVAQTFELARARANPRAGDGIADCIDELVQWAETLDFDGFRKVVRRWEQLADVDGAHQGHEAAHEGRRAAITRLDDTFHLNAQFGVAYGTAMAEILDAFTEAEFQAEWEKIKAEHGDDACPSMMERSAAQRRADAVFAIFMAAVVGRSDRGRFYGPASRKRSRAALRQRNDRVRVDCLTQTFRNEYASRDGPTDQANADPLHGRHNRFKTTHGYRVTRDERGFTHVYRPDDTEIRPH